MIGLLAEIYYMETRDGPPTVFLQSEKKKKPENTLGCVEPQACKFLFFA